MQRLWGLACGHLWGPIILSATVYLDTYLFILFTFILNLLIVWPVGKILAILNIL